MTRAELTRYIFDTYSVAPDYPFHGDDTSAVFRHAGNRKWFALVMNIPVQKLGLPTDARIDIVNMKCDPLLIGSFRGLPGLFPAYHMNRETGSPPRWTEAQKMKSSKRCWISAITRPRPKSGVNQGFTRTNPFKSY